MSVDNIHRCSICSRPTYFSYRFYTTKPPAETDQGLYEIGCSECGEYRIAAIDEDAMTRQTPLRRETVVRLIQAANARGNRYCLNDGREVSLNSVATSGTMATVAGSPDGVAAFQVAPKTGGRPSKATPAIGTNLVGTPTASPTLRTSSPSRTPEPR